MGILDGIIAVLTGSQTIALISLLGANFLLALIAAIKDGSFNLAKLSDFIPRRIAPFLVYVVVAVLAEIITDFAAMAITVYVALAALYVKGVIAAIKSITGLPIPDNISEKLKEN